MKVKIIINCNNTAFGEDDYDKISELNRIFNALIYKSLHAGFKNRMICDLDGKDVGFMEVKNEGEEWQETINIKQNKNIEGDKEYGF